MKKILSILSASALALTMSISAFADDKPSKEEIEKAFMEYAVDEAMSDERKWKNVIENDFVLAEGYDLFIHFLDSNDYSNSKLINIDLSDEKDMKELINEFESWGVNNRAKLYPKIKWDFCSESNQRDMLETGVPSETAYQ